MTDRLINLVSELQDENWRYNISIMHFEDEEFDYVLYCDRLFVEGEENLSFNYDALTRHTGEFAQTSIIGYVESDASHNLPAEEQEGISKHCVEIRVKE